MIGDILDHLIQRAPLMTLARILLERALNPAYLDDLFKRTAVKQYTRTALFSDIVLLLLTVTTRMHRSVGAAYQEYQERLGISLVALCGKFKRTDLSLISGLVRENAMRLGEVIAHLNAELPPLVPGYHTKIVDGNALGATDRRLKPVRGMKSGPLPGKSLVVFDYERDLATEMVPCEDGHAQERSLFKFLAALIRPGELWIADRNFCTKWLMQEIVARGAAFLIRQHDKLRVTQITALMARGTCEGGGTVLEQSVRIGFGATAVFARRIVVVLAEKTRDGDRTLSLLTTLPVEAADAILIANLYRKRWRAETMFKELTTTLRCEVKELAYPRAALFVFAVALLSANLLAAIRAALRATQGRDVEERISSYRMIDDLQGTYRGTELFAPELQWDRFATMPLPDFTDAVVRCAGNIKPERYPKSPKPKHPRRRSSNPEPRGKSKDPPHVSTHRLLQGERALSAARKASK